MPNYDRLPLFPLHAVLFPDMPLPLHIFEERYRLMVARCLERKEPFGVVLLHSGSEVDGVVDGEPDFSTMGTTARIQHSELQRDGRYFVEAKGETRFVIEEVFRQDPYLTARVKPVWNPAGDPLLLQPIFDQACGLFRAYITGLLSASHRHLAAMQLPQDPEFLSYAIAASLQVTLPEKQRLLEMATARERLQREVELLHIEREAQAFLSPPAEPDALESEIPEDDPNERRTILRVDPSYIQYFFSRN